MDNEVCWPMGCATPDACSRFRFCSGSASACAHLKRDPHVVGRDIDDLLDEIRGISGSCEARARDAATRTSAMQAMGARRAAAVPGCPGYIDKETRDLQRGAALDALAAMSEDYDF